MYRVFLMALAILGSGAAFAQEQAPAAPKDRQPARAQDGEGQEPGAEDKERVAAAAIFLLVLVVFTGLALLALVIFWGYRTRRIARSPLPAARQSDPFWYLRPEKGQRDGDERRSGSE